MIDARHHKVSDVLVTGLGLVSPAGVGVRSAWHDLLEGCCFLRRDPVFGDVPWANSGRVPDFDARHLLGVKQAWRMDRFSQLATVAAREAIADADLKVKECDPTRVAVVMGNSLGGTTTLEQEVKTETSEGYDSVSGMLVPKWMPNMLAGSIAIDLGVTGEAYAISSACASGTSAIGHGMQLIQSGQYDVVIAGASESAITPTIMAGLVKIGAISKNPNARYASRPFDAERDGFVIAEAAGVVVLESASFHKTRHNAQSPVAYLRGYGAANDAYHLTAPEPDGTGLQTSVQRALENARITPHEVGYVNAHGTSTPINDQVELAALDRILPEQTMVSSTKGATGHALAAAGAMEAIFTMLALKDQTIPGTLNLKRPPFDTRVKLLSGPGIHFSTDYAMSVSAGFGGHNAAIVFERAA